MFCNKCGAELNGDTCPNGCKTQKQRKPLFKKWWFWMIVGIVVIAIVSSGGNDSTPTTDIPDATNNNTPVQTEATNNTPAQTEATALQDPYYYAGDVIDAGGLKITYVKAEKHEEDNQFLQPDDGYMYIKLYLSVENTASSDRYISSFEFDCYADGKKQESYFTSEEVLEGGNLSSGRKDEGYIYFSVSKDAKDIEVEYETSFWMDKKAVLKVELS